MTNLNNNKNTIVTGCGRYTCKCYVTKLNNCVVCPQCVTIVRNQRTYKYIYKTPTTIRIQNHINNVDKSKKLSTTSKNNKHFKRL